MTPMARRRALRAAAAVAALASCGPRAPVEGAAEVAPSEAVSPQVPAADVVPEVAPDAGLLDVPTCLERTASGEVEGERPCCELLRDHFSENMDAMGAWEGRGACCGMLDWGGGIACTPWGPPAPPGGQGVVAQGALDLRVSARAERIRVQAPPASLRAAAIGTWRARMVNEHGSARVFEALAEQLDAVGHPAAAEQMRGFASEERRHGVLCGAVVESLGGHAHAEREPVPAVPRHPEVEPLEAVLRNLLSVSCLSETVAVALIGAEWADMPEGPLRTLLEQIWSDEIGHARAGWRLVEELLAGADPALRARLAAWLPTALAHLEEHELAHLPAEASFGSAGARWGLCDGQSARALFFEVVRDVIRPSLAAHGVA